MFKNVPGGKEMRCNFGILVVALVALSGSSSPAFGQYEVTRFVISTGGGTSSNAQYEVTGTSGQPVLGPLAYGDPYFLQSGFWNFDLGPTSAIAAIEGRVVTSDGRPLVRTSVIVIDESGAIRSALTNPFGRFRFDGLEAGRTYVIEFSAKGFVSTPQVIFLAEDIAGLELTAFPQ